MLPNSTFDSNLSRFKVSLKTNSINKDLNPGLPTSIIRACYQTAPLRVRFLSSFKVSLKTDTTNKDLNPGPPRVEYRACYRTAPLMVIRRNEDLNPGTIEGLEPKPSAFDQTSRIPPFR